jgi:hypothetical protein
VLVPRKRSSVHGQEATFERHNMQPWTRKCVGHGIRPTAELEWRVGVLECPPGLEPLDCTMLGGPEDACRTIIDGATVPRSTRRVLSGLHADPQVGCTRMLDCARNESQTLSKA